MKLYTRTGDDGRTGLIGGERVDKHHPRVAAYGDVDETNAAIGVACAAVADDAELIGILQRLQSDLFVIGAELADPSGAGSTPRVTAAQVTLLERWIDDATAQTPPLRQFILPGGSEVAARLHVARTVARRAERSAVELHSRFPVRAEVLTYLNRLNDLLFALARLANVRRNVPDIPWTPPSSA